LNRICKHISGLSALDEKYSAFIIDVWGVLHDGEYLYPGVLSCLQQLRAREYTVLIMSNAARRHHHLKDELESVGIGKNLYADLLSSGEMTWQYFNIETTNGQWRDKRAYYLGPERSKGLMENLAISWVSDISQADFILNAGTVLNERILSEESENLLRKASKIDIPMVCANPDLLAIRQGESGLSAGALAQKYRQFGASNVTYFGKPYKHIYDRAKAILMDFKSTEILAVGDSFSTDITGASDAGLDACLIAGGIHREELAPLSIDRVHQHPLARPVPNYVCEYLIW
jgi:HAD superfamily hydrolase (TIGR01459 family)